MESSENRERAKGGVSEISNLEYSHSQIWKKKNKKKMSGQVGNKVDEKLDCGALKVNR